MTWDPNPVRYEDGEWWFWNEIWTERFGPYPDEEAANQACREYCEKEKS